MTVKREYVLDKDAPTFGEVRLDQIIDDAAHKAALAHANDKTGRVLADFIADAVREVLKAQAGVPDEDA